jgi:hypothetical protein
MLWLSPVKKPDFVGLATLLQAATAGNQPRCIQELAPAPPPSSISFEHLERLHKLGFFQLNSLKFDVTYILHGQ